jgi:predicted component of type VI protein secretion system
MNATLLVVTGKTTKRKVALKLPCVLGRSREADVTVAHPLISRRHCELSEQYGLLMLRDLVSLNGTMIGGRRITSAPLLPDAEFTIGPLTFRVLYEYDGDLGSVPPTCYADEMAEAAEVEFAEPAAGNAEDRAPAAVDEAAEAAKLGDSEVVEVADFVTWADAEPEEVAAEMFVEPELADEAPAAVPPAWSPVSHDKRPTEPMLDMPLEPHEDDSALQSGGLKRESPWAAEAPEAESPQRPAAAKISKDKAPAAQSPPQTPKQPNYGDEIDPEFGCFLEGLQ